MNSEVKKNLISIITPCFNEELSVEECVNEVRRVLSTELPHYDYEHIFADNASGDRTVEILRRLANNDSRIKVIVNSRNVGPFRNMWNGLKHASGEIVIPMIPADLQDPPSVIPAMIQEWEMGSLIVYGIRSKRLEGFVMRNLRSLYYKLIRRFSGADIPLNSGEFLLADRRIIDSIIEIDDEYPYIRGLIAQTGGKSSSVKYVWDKRHFGKSKNNFGSLIDQGLNGFISTTRIPARFIMFTGVFFSLLAFFAAGVLFLLFITNPVRPAIGIPTLIISGLFLGGLQLLFLGIIGEYVLSIHSQVRKRPPMFEVERINLPPVINRD
jgi:glycosyltransferase involved in cell wall biosynthesis